MLDAQRRLVLIACDDVEHLLMIGGPADLVIENDVARARAGSQFSAERETVGQKTATGDIATRGRRRTAQAGIETGVAGSEQADRAEASGKPKDGRSAGDHLGRACSWPGLAKRHTGRKPARSRPRSFLS